MADYSVYPIAIDGYAQLPLQIDKKSAVNAESVNRLRSAIVNIENTLGVAPQSSDIYGDFDNVDSRLSSLETIVNSGGGGIPNPIPNDETLNFGDNSEFKIGRLTEVTFGFPFTSVVLGSNPLESDTISDNDTTTTIFMGTRNVTYSGSGTGGTGDINIITGEAQGDAGSSGGRTGSIQIKTGGFADGSGTAGQSGNVQIQTGSSDSDDTGTIEFITGSSSPGASGDISFETGDGFDAGDFAVTTGNSQGGASGNIVFQTGSGGSSPGAIGGNITFEPNISPNPGAIIFNGGIQPTVLTPGVPKDVPGVPAVFNVQIYATGPFDTTRTITPRFDGQIDMLLVRNVAAGVGATLSVSINGSSVTANGGVAGPLTQGVDLTPNVQFLPELAFFNTDFSAGDPITVNFNTNGTGGSQGATVVMYVSAR